MSWWVHDLYEGGYTVLLVSWIFWVIISIVLHELAHGLAALWQGDDTPRRLGHMTPNPLVHMGPWSLLMFAIIGIAWGAMPTDPSRYRWRRKGRFVVAGAGPAMNILIAFITLTAMVIWDRVGPRGEPLYDNLGIFLWTGGWLNILLAAFNLLPIPPLDGANVLCGLSFRCYQFYQNPQVQMFGMFIVLAVFLSGLGGLIFAAADLVAAGYVALFDVQPVF